MNKYLRRSLIAVAVLVSGLVIAAAVSAFVVLWDAGIVLLDILNSTYGEK